MAYGLHEENRVKRVVITESVAEYFEKKVAHDTFFKRKDLRVITVKNGMEALNKINEEKPFLAILEAEMPGMAGTTVASAVKKDRALHNTLVYLVCPVSDKARLSKLAQESKADAFDILDAKSDILLDRVGNLLNISKRAAPRINVNMKVNSPNFAAEAEGRIKNLSRKGMLVEVRHCNFERGFPLVLRFGLNGSTIEVNGDIVRMFFSGKTQAYDVGIEFKKVSPEADEQLKAYVAEHGE